MHVRHQVRTLDGRSVPVGLVCEIAVLKFDPPVCRRVEQVRVRAVVVRAAGRKEDDGNKKAAASRTMAEGCKVDRQSGCVSVLFAVCV